MPATALETRALTRTFGGFRAVRGLGLKVRCHTIHAPIGLIFILRVSFFRRAARAARPRPESAPIAEAG